MDNSDYGPSVTSAGTRALIRVWRLERELAEVRQELSDFRRAVAELIPVENFEER